MRAVDVERMNREEITKCIVEYLKHHCYPPTCKEIAEASNLSTVTVRRHLDRMLEDGVLETEHPGESRAYRIKNTKIVGRRG